MGMTFEEIQKMPLRKWVSLFNSGAFDYGDNGKATWYDWFCRSSSLPNKTRKIGNILKDIKNDYVLDNFYVWFKNNCPMVGPLYDDCRFENFDTTDTDDRLKDYFLFTIDDKRSEFKYNFVTFKKTNDPANLYEDVTQGCKTKSQLLKLINAIHK